MESRITPDLTSRVDKATPTEVVQVIVELRPMRAPVLSGFSHQERMKRVQETKVMMSADLQPVEEAIIGLGGKVVDFVWLNRTILADVPASQVRELADIDNVHLVDIPHSLHLDHAR